VCTHSPTSLAQSSAARAPGLVLERS